MISTLEKEMTLYFSNMNTTLIPIIDNDKSIVFVNDSIFFAIIAQPDHLDIERFKALLKEDETPENVEKKLLVKKGIQYGKGKVCFFIYFLVKKEER